ncbi:hypothetical protein H5410_049079 [Solanum commersonii]|uniref:Uncharacterized protein n=1 Tax=Solanum commersonii TaxID=4109 RepID=A0A9J5XLC7_SOLCO|nr:hypothetical protein H5410_049079 [Solanum commersonii]
MKGISSKEKHEHEELKEKVRQMLVESPDNRVAYHFKNDIETSIQNICKEFQQSKNDDDLYVVALRFRLVRQQRHYMSSDVFKRFTNDGGKFKETLTIDVQGLLSLYEAAHLRIHGEEILEEALTFTVTHLESMGPKLGNSLKAQVSEALSQPIHTNLPRLVECYFEAVGLHFEPQRSRARIMTGKILSILNIVDDTFDAYTTFDELVLFTNAIERSCDISAMESVSHNLRPIYQVLIEFLNELEDELKKKMKKWIKSYFKEAEWLNTCYFPKCEEYMENAIPSIAIKLIATISLICLEELIISKETFEWVTSDSSSFINIKQIKGRHHGTSCNLNNKEHIYHHSLNAI